MPTNGTPSGEVSRVGDSTSLKLRISPYSPECVEGDFCELRHNAVLGSSAMLAAFATMVQTLQWGV
jgi:hypothetical protein